jgi:hypothetical protein
VLVNLSQEPLSFLKAMPRSAKRRKTAARDPQHQTCRREFQRKTGTADDPVDFADASALATAAQNYQAEQAKQGRTISMTDAVNHVKKGAQQ